MREILGFIKWMCGGMDIWKMLIILSALANVVALFFIGTDTGRYLNYTGMGLLVFVFSKWFIWDMISYSWTKYKQHRNELLTTIKTSDER